MSKLIAEQRHAQHNLPVVWTSDIKDPVKKKKFEQAVRNSAHDVVLRKLKDIIGQRIDRTGDIPLKLEEYDNPAWAYKQAHLNGYAAGLQFVYDLINIEKE